MSTQVQINSADRDPLFDGAASTPGHFTLTIKGAILTGWWELSYGMFNNSFTGTQPTNYFLYITFEGAPLGLRTAKRSCNFSIPIIAAPSAMQEYTPRNRKQKINFTPTGMSLLTIKVQDNTGAIVNFNSVDWSLVLQKCEPLDKETDDN